MTPVDATGAGDCFNAGLIAGLLDGLDLAGAAALGCAAGALSTAAPGGTASAPSRAAAAGWLRPPAVSLARASRDRVTLCPHDGCSVTRS